MSPGDFPVSQAQCDWFYQRSGGTVMHSPYKLNSGWFELERYGDYRAPNYVAEAGKDFGVKDDRIRIALTNAAMLKGTKVGDMATAVSIAAKAAKLDPKKLRKAAESAVVKQRVEASTAEFLAHQISQRPSFILTDPIGDKAVFSELVGLEPLAAMIDAMLTDTAAYVSHEALYGKAPTS